MPEETIGWYGDLATTRWRLDLPPGRVLDRIEREAARDNLGADVKEHGFRLWVRRFVGIGRRNAGPFLDASVWRDEDGSVVEFRIGTVLGPLAWLMPTILAAAVVGGILGFGGYLAARTSDATPLLGTLICAALPIGPWVLVIFVNGSVMHGKGKRLHRFLEDVLDDVRILDAESADRAVQEPPKRGSWLVRVAAVVVPLLVGAGLGALFSYASERRAEHDHALVTPVREADPNDVARVRFAPSPDSPVNEPIVVDAPEAVKRVCEALSSGHRTSVGKGTKIEWAYELTLEWSDGGTSRCEIKKAKDKLILRIREHRGGMVSTGGGDFELGPPGEWLLDPRKVQP